MRSLLRTVAEAAGQVELGERVVVCVGTDGSAWNTGLAYRHDSAAFGLATRLMNRDECNAYVVKRFPAGLTVYLSPETILGTVST